MGDHVHALAAAMRFHGMPARVLPPTDDRSMALGSRACGGRECLPALLVVGDVLRRCEEPDFEPCESAFYLPTACGPCRFGQYSMLLRDLLDEKGLGEVVVSSPSTTNSFQGFGERPRQLRQLAWQGLVAIDLLIRLLLENRPYEVEPGSTTALYDRELNAITRAVEQGGGSVLVTAMRQAADRFGALPVERHERPVVGLVGEVYVRWNAYSNRNLVEEVERLGGEVMIASMAETIYFITYRAKEVGRVSGQYGDLVRAMLVDGYQARAERRLLRAVEHRLRRPDESPSRSIAEAVEPFYDATLGTEAVLSMGRAVELARLGVHGIVNVLPFSCMPGVIVGGMAPRIRRELDWIPWLDLPYDAQKETNVRTRLEAFVHQAEQFRRRVGTDPVRDPRPAAVG
ncbi:MAG: hypothetical protein GWN02_04470 [Gemmatimonadetes bacterium]|nr:hypothetical protein [Gemmatimonadota bacterium]